MIMLTGEMLTYLIYTPYLPIATMMVWFAIVVLTTHALTYTKIMHNNCRGILYNLRMLLAFNPGLYSLVSPFYSQPRELLVQRSVISLAANPWPTSDHFYVHTQAMLTNMPYDEELHTPFVL